MRATHTNTKAYCCSLKQKLYMLDENVVSRFMRMHTIFYCACMRYCMRTLRGRKSEWDRVWEKKRERTNRKTTIKQNSHSLSLTFFGTYICNMQFNTHALVQRPVRLIHYIDVCKRKWKARLALWNSSNFFFVHDYISLDLFLESSCLLWWTSTHCCCGFSGFMFCFRFLVDI